MNTYSFIMDFRGGTYIYQIDAAELQKAFEIWANNLNVSEVKYLGDKSKDFLLNNKDELTEFLNPIDTVKNIWHTSFDFKTGTASIHVIKTDNQAIENNMNKRILSV